MRKRKAKDGEAAVVGDPLLKKAKERYRVLSDYWSDNRNSALEDIRFRSGDQWPENLKRAREKKGRPALVLDKLNQYIRQVVNDGRQNRPSIKFRPVGDGDVKVAEAFDGITRSILRRSNADEAFDTALDHSAGHGFGFFRVLTDYADKEGFEQDICVKRVRNSLSVLTSRFDAADGSDMEDAFVVDELSKSEFESRYPKAEKTDWQTDGGEYEDWLEGDTVRVAEYWYKEREPVTIHLLEDGTTVDDEDYQAAVKAGVVAPPIVQSREVMRDQVKWAKLSGAEVLEKGDWLGDTIPIYPVLGTETDINGKLIYTGLTRPGKNGQQLYNYARTAFAERVALTPKAPWVAAAGQTEEFPEWATANEENHSVLVYNPVEVNGNALPGPQRMPAADIPAGFAQEMQQAEHDIQAALGMYAASLGQPSNEKSGKAIIARQREGDVATYHYHDNLNRAINRLGRDLVKLIPRVYDSRRVVRLLNEDGTDRVAMVAPDLPNGSPTAKIDGMEVFNLNVGKYDVETTTGPSYTTKRQEATEAMIQIAQGNPGVWQTHGDLIVKAMDWPGADEFAKRTKATMPPPLQQAIMQSENEDGPPPEVQMVMQQAQAEIQQREQALQQAQQIIEELKRQVEDKGMEMQSKAVEVDVKRQEIGVKEKELEIKAFDAETKRLQATQAGITPEMIQTIAVQTFQQLQTPTEIEEEVPAVASPELIALLDAFNMRTEEMVRAMRAPRRRVVERDPRTGVAVGVIDAPEDD